MQQEIPPKDLSFLNFSKYIASKQANEHKQMTTDIKTTVSIRMVNIIKP